MTGESEKHLQSRIVSMNQSVEWNQYLPPWHRWGERGRRRSWTREAPLVWQPSNPLTQNRKRSNRSDVCLHSFCSLFLKCIFHRTISGSGVMESKASQSQASPVLLSLPPLPCLSLSAAARTSNRCFSCRFWPLGGGAYVHVAFFIPPSMVDFCKTLLSHLKLSNFLLFEKSLIGDNDATIL